MSILDFFKNRYNTPVEKRSYGKIYLSLSALLLLSTAWAVIDEVKTRRPWKNYQTEYFSLLEEKLKAKYDEEVSSIDSSVINNLKREFQTASKILESDDYKKLNDELDDLQKDFINANRDWKFARSESDAKFYAYQQNKIETGNENQNLKNELIEIDSTISQSARLMKEIELKISNKKSEIAKLKNLADSLEKEIVLIETNSEKFLKRMKTVNSSPILINQVILNDFEKTNFGDIKARIDRCQTCHLGAMENLMSEAPQPYTQHSLPELLKIHNPEKFGCTPCHRGQGNALTKGFAHGDEDHYWETPLLKGKDVYASCNSCHFQQVYLKDGVNFSKAKQTFLESGCVGCHYLNGYNDVKKIGPHLNLLAKKVSPEWTYRWIKNPTSYNAHTRMPNFKFSDDQSEAITAFLFDLSKQTDFSFTNQSGSYVGGSASEGEKIFESVGCQACHVVGNKTKVREARATGYDIAPELTKAGTKLNGDWIFDWLKNPKHFSPDTKMPNLRLTDSEAKHLTAFILSNKDLTKHEKIKLDLQSKEKIIKGGKLIKEFGCFGCHNIKGTEKEGKVSVNLSDFGRKRVEQMDFGNTNEIHHNETENFKIQKDGKIFVKHSWDGWVTGKLYNPRLYQTERIIQKMPVFNFNETDRANLKLMLMSYRVDNPVVKYQQGQPDRLSDINKGQKLIIHYACINCHNIEDQGSYFAASLDDPAYGPPNISMTGAKVQEPWLVNFLNNPSPIRPWLKVRMPTFNFTEEEINTISKYFLATSKKKLELRNYSAHKVNEANLEKGKYLFETFQCIKCHKLGGDVTDAASLAPDLLMAKNRLKPEWIVDWLRDPQVIQPGTMMPGFFPDGETPLPDELGGNSNLQMEAIRDHLFKLKK